MRFDPSNMQTTTVKGHDLKGILFELLQKSQITTAVFDRTSRKVELDRQIDSLCEEVFNAVRIVKSIVS